MTPAALQIIRHRGLIGVVLAAAIGYSAWSAYRLGITIGNHMASDAARAASEAMGG